MKKTFTYRLCNISFGVLALIFLMTFQSEKAFAQPSFTHGPTQSFSIRQGAPAFDISSMLPVSEVSGTPSETWTVLSSGTGTLSGFPYSNIYPGTTLTPTGLFYTPGTGFSGTDVFTIQVSDGTSTDTTRITVTVNPLPAAGVISGGASHICYTGANTTATFSETFSDGTWNSSNSGIVTMADNLAIGLSPGTAIISYTRTNSCGDHSDTVSIRVDDVLMCRRPLQPERCTCRRHMVCSGRPCNC